METASKIFRVLFLVMDLMLLVIMPLALLKDLCCTKKTTKKKSYFKSKIVSIIGITCFALIILVDVFIFNAYIDTTTGGDSSTSD